VGGVVTVGRSFGEGSERLDGFGRGGGGGVKNVEKIMDVLYVRPPQKGFGEQPQQLTPCRDRRRQQHAMLYRWPHIR
jgi:hypothetical protein